jgi:L-asparaginase
MQVSVKKIVVLGTGGTIAGKAATAHDQLAYAAGAVPVADLLRGLPVAGDFALQAEQVANIDSKDMEFAIWLELARRCAHWLAQDEVQGIVVTHGTDTLEETAFFLQSVLAPGKPVVLTGAMRPATSSAADGPQNLADALAIAAMGGARGVTVVFAGGIYAAGDVMKAHNYRSQAFSAGDAAPVGYLEDFRFRPLRPWPVGGLLRPVDALPPPGQWPRVEIVMSHAGATGAVVRALVADGVAGLVVAGTGNGSLHQALEEALLDAQRAGVAVRRTSRCPEGVVIPLPADKLPHAAGLSPVKARIALMLELMR